MKLHIQTYFNTLDEQLESWFDQHGHDYPNYLPYWVKYMPTELRIYFLNKEGYQFKDYTNNMLGKDYDWKDWTEYFEGDYES